MQESFKKRIAKFWETFAKEEGQIREMIDNKAQAEPLLNFMDSMLQTAFTNSYFEMGTSTSDNKYELTLTPEGDRIRLFQLHYWRQYAPVELLDRWNFYSSRPAKRLNEESGGKLSMYDVDITEQDITIYPTVDEDNRKVNIEVYAPKMHDMEDNENYSMLFILLDQYIGEVYAMEYIGLIDFVEDPLETEAVLLNEFKAFIDKRIEENEWPEVENPSEVYSTYKMKPTENSRWALREDIMTGYSSCMPILNVYHNKNKNALDYVTCDGATWGFLFFENSGFPQETIVASRSEIEDKIMEQAQKAGIADSVGGATGFHFSYIDFIIYDYEAFIEIAKEVLRPYNFEEVGYSEFIYGSELVLLN